MKGFSLPSISIPSISIPSISITKNIDSNAIKSAISSVLPDLSSIANGLNIEGLASDMLSEAMSEGINMPSELKDLIK